MAILLDAVSGAELSRNIRAARTPWARTIGYLLRSAVTADEGLWFDACDAIHTIGMRAVIDVLFLDGEGKILALESPARHGRAYRVAGARTVLECGAGFAVSRKLAVGACLRLVG